MQVDINIKLDTDFAFDTILLTQRKMYLLL